MGTDEVCHAEATALTEGSSGCFLKKKKKNFFLKKEIQSFYSLEKTQG